MKQVAAKLKGAESADAQFEAARDMMLAGGASMVYHFMSDEDVERIMRHPLVGIASDSSVLTMGEGVPHPRGYGNNARVLGEYVRERKVITLEEAVRKMTSLPAEQFRFADRGAIARRVLRATSWSSTARPSATRRRSTSRTPTRAASRTCSSTACPSSAAVSTPDAKPGQALMLPRAQSPKR